MTDDRHEVEKDAHSGMDTTGHEWDGVKELDTPLPRWWLWIFYATIIWAVIYMIFMPAIPGLPGIGDHTRGLRDHSERANVVAAVEALEDSRRAGYAALEGASIADIQADPDLLNFTLAAGESAFGDNCSTCHGSGGQGAIGYPSLADDVWLWDGSFEGIRHTLRVGIRSEHPDTRFSAMPAFGRDQLLSEAEIREVTDYVLSLSGQEHDAERAVAGAEIYELQCASCHMEGGVGDRSQGAPNLSDREWLYGGAPEQIRNTIWRGPYGVMPAWEGSVLDDNEITALAAYVYLLGGGEAQQEAALIAGD